MKRDPRLHGLSSEHHHGLVLARRVAQARLEAASVRQRFDAELEPHFQLEEEALLPALEAAGAVALAARTRREHAELRQLDATVVAVHASPRSSRAPCRSTERVSPPGSRPVRRSAASSIDRSTSCAREAKLAPDRLVARLAVGVPADEIRSIAERDAVGLVVLVSRRRPRRAGGSLGSIEGAVLRGSFLPVLVIPDPPAV